MPNKKLSSRFQDLVFNASGITTLMHKAQRLAVGDYSVEFVTPETKTGPEANLEFAEALESVRDQMQSLVSETRSESARQNQFISDVSHELRTPLTAIRGAAETMLDPDISPADARHFAQTIIRESERLTRLTKDLTTLERIDSNDNLTLGRVNLRDVAQAVAEVMRPLLAERGVELQVRGEAPDILANADRVQQVVQNLVDNASRYTQSGGHVVVQLSGVREMSVLTVADDGPGFGDVDPTRLFDRFYRGDPSRAAKSGGTGLGLAIVKAIVDGYDGTVEAFNLPEHGAAFVVAIPSVGMR
ncbi:MAG: HAMP domain-containing histidine kinase [Coriobacteriales bacterium]|jgi:two-component system OmpR family sensor kinase|nr:HAMP domain-containing histidine kinase [Coriobacteriales bacterium]